MKKRVISLLLMMALLVPMGSTASATNFTVPVKSDVDSMIAYDKFVVEPVNSADEFIITDNTSPIADEFIITDSTSPIADEYVCETIAIDENTCKIVKPDGEVIAICSSLEDNVNLVAENVSWEFDFQLQAGQRGRGANQFIVGNGFTFN